jgi:16S rRNA G966 N2-methylase RsmD
MYLYYNQTELESSAAELAKIVPDAKIELIHDNIDKSIPYLCYEETGLVVYAPNFKPINLHEFYSDFIYKRRSFLAKENLLQALNFNKLKSHEDLTALDLTGGLGRDAIIFALAGIKVTIIERNPYLVIILNYLQQNFVTQGFEVNVIYADSLTFLQQNTNQYTCIYYDPMFADNKQALAKKDMQLIDWFVGMSIDTCVNNLAIKICHKLIVKRDNKQEFLIKQLKPTYQKLGKTIRFDVYQGILKCV